MGGYIKSGKVRNLKLKNDYIKNHDIADMDKDYYDTADSNFWELLASENHARHTEAKGFCKNGYCIEARQLIIGIPQNSNITAKELCDTFKSKYGVECCCAIHTKTNELGNIVNKHAHLLFSERKKLDKPEITEEKRAVRTYYYDKNGKKCKKAEAVKTVPKGTIISKGVTHYFASKNEFFGSLDFVNDVKDLFLNKVLGIGWNKKEDIENRDLGLSQKHIGYENVNSEFIKNNNELKKLVKASCEVNYYHLDKDLKNKYKTLKSYKKEILDSNVINLRTRSFSKNFENLEPFILDTQTQYNTVLYSKTNEQIHSLNQTNNEILEKQGNKLIDDISYEDFKIIDKLDSRWKKIFKDLQHFLSFQRFFTNIKFRINLMLDKDNYIYIKRNSDNLIVNEKQNKKSESEEM